jgi:hypothetical protein
MLIGLLTLLGVVVGFLISDRIQERRFKALMVKLGGLDARITNFTPPTTGEVFAAAVNKVAAQAARDRDTHDAMARRLGEMAAEPAYPRTWREQ